MFPAFFKHFSGPQRCDGAGKAQRAAPVASRSGATVFIQARNEGFVEQARKAREKKVLGEGKYICTNDGDDDDDK